MGCQGFLEGIRGFKRIRESFRGHMRGMMGFGVLKGIAGCQRVQEA